LTAKQATDSNAAAWAAYYAQLYGQAGSGGQQPPAQQQQPQQQQQQPAVGAYGTPASSGPAAQPQPSKFTAHIYSLALLMETRFFPSWKTSVAWALFWLLPLAAECSSQ